MRETVVRQGTRVRDAGFTLLEVLAAVAILGIWFTVLATVAIQGLRAEGGNARTSRASLVADGALVDIETEIENGSFPLDEIEIEQDEFHILVRAVPLSEAVSDESGLDLSTYLIENLGSVNENLYEIQVEVGWIEGVDERTLTRSTYAWDSSAYLEALAGTAPDGEDNGTGDNGAAQGRGDAGSQNSPETVQ
jgi:prepilin-type N-terminal cleavage/methylation domain-containing protein